MANKTAIIAAGTNDASSQSAQTQTNLTNTITKLQNEGYEVVVIPPNSATKAVQHEAAVNAATAKGATIFEGTYGKIDTSSLTSASAASIRNTFPNAFVVGDNNAVLINNGVETPTAVLNRATGNIFNSVNMTDFLTGFNQGGTVNQFESGNVAYYKPPVTTTDQSDVYAAANPVPSTAYTDFTGGLQDFNTYLDREHHIQKDIQIGTQDQGRAVIKAEYSYTMRELLCGLLAGRGLKLPNIQMCLALNVQGLQNVLAGVGGEIANALGAVQGALDEFLDHTSINSTLDRINAVIQEAASIANMINFCGTPIQPKAIPNLLQGAMGSFLGNGMNIANLLGSIIPSEISACASLGADGKPQFNANIFNGGVLKEIGNNINAILAGSHPQNLINEYVSTLNQVAGEFKKLIDKENYINGTGGSGYSAGGSQFTCQTGASEMEANKLYEIETLGTTNFTSVGAGENTVGTVFIATGPGSGTGCVKEVNTGIGVLHNPDSAGVAGNAALATSIKSAYDQVGGYKVVANDGTVHDNVFDLILEPSMLDKVRQSDNFAGLQQDQNPVYDYCGNVIGFTSVTTGGSPERSQGEAPIVSNLAGNLGAGDRATPQANMVHTQKSPGIQATNTGVDTVSAETHAPPRLPSVSTTEREKLNAINGDLIFNDSDKKIEAYVNNQWIDLSTGGGSGGGGSGGSSAITVQDENVSLSSTATTLNFTGAGVTASGTGAIKTINIPGGSGQNSFQTIAVSGQNNVTADTSTDTLTLVAGTGISLTTDSGLDSVTVTNTQPENSISQGNSNVTVSDTGSNGTITFDTEGVDRWQISSAGNLVPVANETYDIGSASYRVRDIYVSNSSIKFGASAIPLTVSGTGRLNFNSKQLMEDLVDDTTPQLGGTLDANGNTIDMGTNILTDTNLGQFITAYGWGNHASAGYLTTADVYKQIIVTDTDTGFTYAETGTHTASGLTDTFTFVGGTGIDLDVDTTNGALRISRAGTGASFSQSSFTGDGTDTTFDTGNTNLVDVQVFVNGVLMTPGTDYTFSAATGIITFSVAPLLNDEIYAYEYTETPGSITLSTLGIPNHDKITVDGSGNINLDDNEKLKFGNDGDLEIYHSGADSFIDDTGTGSIFIRSGTTYFQNAGGTKTSIQTNAGAGQTIYFNNDPVFQTTATGIYLKGSTIEFEGTGDDAYETILTATNPTSSDKTITLPDASGTVVLQDSNNDVTIQADTTNSGVDPTLVLYKNDTGTVSDTDGVAAISFKGTNANGGTHVFGWIQSKIENATAGSEEGHLRLSVAGSDTGYQNEAYSNNPGNGIVIYNDRSEVRGDLIAKTSDGAILKLQTSDTTVIDGNTLGAIEFSAPNESSGTDAITTAASIVAEADATFSSTTNTTDLVFKLGQIGTAQEKLRLHHEGDMTLTNNTNSSDHGPIFKLFKNPPSGTMDGYNLGTIDFLGTNTASPNPHLYARIYVEADDGTSNTEDGSIRFRIGSSGTEANNRADTLKLQHESVSITGNLTVTEEVEAGSYKTTNYTDDDGTSTLTTTSATTIDTWPAGADSGEYLIEAIQGSDKQVCKIVCLDTGSDLLISVYGILYTSASPLVTFTGSYYSGSPILQATPASASSMTIKWKRTFIN